MITSFTPLNAYIILNEYYDISHLQYSLYEFKPNIPHLEVDDENIKIILHKVIIEADNILDAMEYFINILINNELTIVEND